MCAATASDRTAEAEATPSVTDGQPETVLGEVASLAGYVLAISYPVLALSTGVRAGYQLLFKPGVTDYLPPAMSAVAALSYLLATIGFAYRRRWAWHLSVGVLSFETLMTLLVGTLTFVVPDVIGSTVWRYYGVQYGFFPLFQPLLGLVWLLWPPTTRAYGVDDDVVRWRERLRAVAGR